MTDPDLIGVAEGAQRLGIHRSNFARWARRPDFPAPVCVLRMGTVWRWSEVAAWHRAHMTMTPRRKTSAIALPTRAEVEAEGFVAVPVGDEPPRGYLGPIRVGDHFIWEKNKPRAWAHVVVTRIETGDPMGRSFDERRIWTRDAEGETLQRLIDEMVRQRYGPVHLFRSQVERDRASGYKASLVKLASKGRSDEVWNEEGRFREAVTPCDAHGVETSGGSDD